MFCFFQKSFGFDDKQLILTGLIVLPYIYCQFLKSIGCYVSPRIMCSIAAYLMSAIAFLVQLCNRLNV